MTTIKPLLIVYSGPMFAGKSTSLINSYEDSKTPTLHKLVFKYAKDTRYSNNAEIVTHNKETIPCIMISKCADITTYLNSKFMQTLEHPTVGQMVENNKYPLEIYIDECQFMPDIYDWITEIQNQLISPNDVYYISKIFVAGLDLDANGNYFTEAFKKVLDIADVNHALTAKCYICNEEAYYTKLLVVNNHEKMNGNILIGGAELYQPACETHFK